MKHRAKTAALDDPGASSLVESITRFWLTTIIIVGILYAAVLLISRSDGFRDIVQQRLTLLAGMPVTVGRVWADPFLNLEVERVEGSVETNRPVPDLLIGHASLTWRWIPLLKGEGWPFRRLGVEDVELRFTQGTNGMWHPFSAWNSLLAPWMKLPEVGQADTNRPVTEIMRDLGIRLTVRNGVLRWIAPLPDEPPLAVAEGIQFRSVPSRPVDEDVMWFMLKVARAETAEVEWLEQVDMEWIRTSEKDVLVKQDGRILSEEQRLWQHGLLHGRD